MPNGNGIEVTSYEVEIKNTNGNWEKTTECEISEINPRDSTIYQSTYNDAGDHLFCNVNMETLNSPDGYNLDFDSLIEVRVRAESYAGFGLWSTVNIDGARTRQKPA